MIRGANAAVRHAAIQNTTYGCVAILAETLALSTKREGSGPRCDQEFALRQPFSTSVSLVDGTPAFKSPSR